MLERHAAETLAAASAAYKLKLKNSRSARSKSELADLKNYSSMDAGMNGNEDYISYNPVFSRGVGSSPSQIKTAFIPSSGQPENKEHNLKARQQSSDRARLFRNQSRISHDKVDFP